MSHSQSGRRFVITAGVTVGVIVVLLMVASTGVVDSGGVARPTPGPSPTPTPWCVYLPYVERSEGVRPTPAPGVGE